MEEVARGTKSASEWFVGSNGSLLLGGRLVVPDDRELQRQILDDSYKS